ncbi:cystatin-1 [Tetranychus urticae]|uniref:Cystatin domain-containing protein n=1 Tax=Tetranychus urticae TaxID=32264 RepID=T1KDZ6_TETUR|nr:cystatin-1 [Tetranychus urticae]
MKVILALAICLIGVSEALLGGWRDVDVDNQTVHLLSQMAINHRNSDEDTLYYRKLVNVESARMQVVSGLKYEVTLVIGETHCAKEDEAAMLCQVEPNSLREKCVYTFWLEAKTQNTNIVTSSCSQL